MPPEATSTTTAKSDEVKKISQLPPGRKMIDPLSEAALDDKYAAQRYLFSQNFSPLGDPKNEHTRWWDPQRIREDRYEKQVRMAPHITLWNDQKKCYDTEMRPVMVKDRHNQAIPCQQTILIPAGQPYSLNDALMVARNREREAAEKEALAETKAA